MTRMRHPGRWMAALAMVTLCAILAGCGPSAYKITPVPVDQRLEENTVMNEGGLAPPKIVLVDVDGIIMNRRRMSLFSEGENPVSLFVEKLDKAADDPAVRGLILRINSPGGSVTASDLMYTELLRFKECTKHERPVVAVMMDVTASGGYYLACGADEMIAHRTTVTGSIGVIMQMVNVTGTMRKIGVEAEAIKSGKMKDAGSPLRPLKSEERELFQELVDQFYDRFVEVVVAGRKMDEAKVRSLADGRVYSAEQALEHGFIDKIGTLRDAVCDIKEKIGAERVKVVTYDRPLGWNPNIYASNPTQPAQLNLFNVTMPEGWTHPEAQFLYLWSPGL